MKFKCMSLVLILSFMTVLAHAEPGKGDAKGHTHSDLDHRITLNADDIVGLKADLASFEVIAGERGPRGYTGDTGIGEKGERGIAGTGEQGVAGKDADMSLVNANTKAAKAAYDGTQSNAESINKMDYRMTSMRHDLKKSRDDMHAAVASAMAMGVIPKASPGDRLIGFGLGVFGGEQAVAVSFSSTSLKKKHSFAVSISKSRESFGGAASYTVSF